MTRTRICMVGAGRVGRLHTRTLHERLADRAEVVAVVDPAADVARALADDFAIPVVAGGLHEVLATTDCDGVVITTPTFTHRDLAVMALEAGKHTHLEKPMAMDLRECHDITAAATTAGVALQVGFMRRFDRNFVEAAALLASGDIGVPMIVKSLTHGPGLPPAWANDIRTSNGMLAEVNSHDLDTACWFADSEPVDITVRVANFKGDERGATAPGFYDTLLAMVTFESGAMASIAGVCPADYGYDARVEVTTTGGMVQVGDQGPTGLTTIAAGSGVRTDPVFPSWRNRFADAYVLEMEEFVAAADGADVRVGAAEGTRTAALVLAGTLSLLERRTVAVEEVTDPDFVPSWLAGAVAL